MNDQQHRTSLYLVRRAEALLGALRFFAGASIGNQRRLQFLAQIDFWEWEIDNLIYSFTNLAERQRTWNSAEAARQKLGRLGVAVSAKLIRSVRWRGKWRIRFAQNRVAPVDLLREVIEIWNRLVETVEQQFILPMRDKARKWNIQTPRDLHHLRKEMPPLEDTDEK
jgi:hypothetical protein